MFVFQGFIIVQINIFDFVQVQVFIIFQWVVLSVDQLLVLFFVVGVSYSNIVGMFMFYSIIYCENIINMFIFVSSKYSK